VAKLITNNKWVNLAEVEHNGKKWEFATRNKDLNIAPICNAVFIAAQLGEKLVLIKEYRPAIQGYQIGIPAGLIEEDEEIEVTATRELKEETGLDLVKVDYISPLLTSSAGLTDEMGRIVFCTAKGKVSKEFLQPGEEIEVIVADYNLVSYMVKAREFPFGSRAYTAIMSFLTLRGWKFDG
jgi:ADP-ribose pyrophosphatase